MTTEELATIIEKVTHQQIESQTLEVKAAHGGNPKKIYDTLSSFSNQDDGGILLFGIDEKMGFEKVGVYDPRDLQNKIVEQCNEMIPKIRPLITIYEEDGKFFLTAEIPAIDSVDRPCYYAGKGRPKGSYIRVGQSDEPMTMYEIFSYEAFRKKYREDIRLVERANESSLDQDAVQRYLFKLRENKPNLAKLDDHQILNLMSMVVDGHPTISSILLFCPYPQAFFPQLTINAVSVPGTQIGDIGINHERFTDNKRIEGTIEDMLSGTLAFIKNNMKVSTIVDAQTGLRKDSADYPMVALREVVLNALVHRDYSIHTEGMPIQVLMFTDRIEIKNPGGLYGKITLDQLGKIQPDTRNPVLATTMEVLSLTENRYSGIPTIFRSMKEGGNPDPVFESSRGIFTVTLRKRSASETLQISRGDNSSDFGQLILEFCKTPKTRKEIADYCAFKSVSYFYKMYVAPLVEKKLLLMSNPEHPKSPTQTYTTATEYFISS
ncbi:MAG: ATP-binding protein [Sphaerochaeta sp.]